MNWDNISDFVYSVRYYEYSARIVNQKDLYKIEVFTKTGDLYCRATEFTLHKAKEKAEQLILMQNFEDTEAA